MWVNASLQKHAAPSLQLLSTSPCLCLCSSPAQRRAPVTVGDKAMVLALASTAHASRCISQPSCSEAPQQLTTLCLATSEPLHSDNPLDAAQCLSYCANPASTVLAWSRLQSSKKSYLEKRPCPVSWHVALQVHFTSYPASTLLAWSGLQPEGGCGDRPRQCRSHHEHVRWCPAGPVAQHPAERPGKIRACGSLAAGRACQSGQPTGLPSPAHVCPDPIRR